MINTYKNYFNDVFKIIFYFSILCKCILPTIVSLFFVRCFDFGPSLKLPPIFSDSMILQRETDVYIWGESYPSTQVEVVSSWGKNSKTISDLDGRWRTKLSTPEAGGPYTISIKSKKSNIAINDVLIGEVWIASGQSNMEMPLEGWLPHNPIENSESEILNAEFPQVRMFHLYDKINDEKKEFPPIQLNGKWITSSKQTAQSFSAVGYFFAVELHKNLDIPVGILHASMGGSPLESWISEDKLRNIGSYIDTLDALNKGDVSLLSNRWFDRWESIDIPYKERNWNKIKLSDFKIDYSNYNDSTWHKTRCPTRYDKLIAKNFDGIFLFRKNFEILNENHDYFLHIGAIDDMDKIFINGNYIGGLLGTGHWNKKRNYRIPQSFLKKGNNVITILCIDSGGIGTIKGPLYIENEYAGRISIDGIWRYKPVAEIYRNKLYLYTEKTDISERVKISNKNQFFPGSLFKIMIEPLAPYTIKGAIWYQGESNIGRHRQYKTLFPELIKDWRKNWEKDFPFYFVQIAPFRYEKKLENHKSQKLREAQKIGLQLPKTGMVVTLDIGDINNIHPSNKKEVGKRLSNLALKNDYGINKIAESPRYKSNEVENDTLILMFDYAKLGLVLKNSLNHGFEIAGENKKFYKAQVKIKDNSLVCLFSEFVNEPKFGRYAWSDTSSASLFNMEGLPASSFTTELDY